MKKKIARGFYFITDDRLSKNGNMHDVQSALRAHVSAIQYRNKDGRKDLVLKEAKALRSLCTETPFIVNDFLDVAIAVDADGLHIGKTDVCYEKARQALGEEKIIGVSVHTLEEALRAEAIGADYIGLGPIFRTSTKPDAERPCGVDLIRRIKKACSISVVAIGGINLENVQEVISAGADGVCAISATIMQTDVKKEIDKYHKLFKIDNLYV